MTVNRFIKLCLKKNVTAEHKFISYRSSNIVIAAKIGEKTLTLDNVPMNHITFGDWCKRVIRLKCMNGTMMVENWPSVMSLKAEDIAIDNQYIKL
mgnify:FL=1